MRFLRRSLLALAPLVLVVVGCGGNVDAGGSGTDAGSDTSGCTKGETRHTDCNTCTCLDDGTFACTTLACADSGRPDTATYDAGGFDIGGFEEGTDAHVSDPRCPGDWAAAQGSHDDLCAAHLSCDYTEGSCTCPAYCGGVPPGPDWKPTWTCTPKPPPRTDGCPDVEPTGGSACTTFPDHKVCDYGSCCFDQLECAAGAWKKSGPICPP